MRHGRSDDQHPAATHPKNVREADRADQDTSAEPEVGEVLAESARTSHSVITQADIADLAAQDTVAHVGGGPVEPTAAMCRGSSAAATNPATAKTARTIIASP